jgi:hypothetical protein
MLRAFTKFYEYLRSSRRRRSTWAAVLLHTKRHGRGGSASGSGSKTRPPELVWSARIVGKAGSLHGAGASFVPLQIRLGRHREHHDDFRPPLLPDLPNFELRLFPRGNAAVSQGTVGSGVLDFGLWSGRLRGARRVSELCEVGVFV